MDLFEILGISYFATKKEIEDAFIVFYEKIDETERNLRERLETVDNPVSEQVFIEKKRALIENGLRQVREQFESIREIYEGIMDGDITHRFEYIAQNVDLYKMVKLDRSASQEEIIDRLNQIIHRCSSEESARDESNESRTENAIEIVTRIREIIENPEKRAEYDRRLDETILPAQRRETEEIEARNQDNIVEFPRHSQEVEWPFVDDTPMMAALHQMYLNIPGIENFRTTGGNNQSQTIIESQYRPSMGIPLIAQEIQARQRLEQQNNEYMSIGEPNGTEMSLEEYARLRATGGDIPIEENPHQTVSAEEISPSISETVEESKPPRIRRVVRFSREIGENPEQTETVEQNNGNKSSGIRDRINTMAIRVLNAANERARNEFERIKRNAKKIFDERVDDDYIGDDNPEYDEEDIKEIKKPKKRTIIGIVLSALALTALICALSEIPQPIPDSGTQPAITGQVTPGQTTPENEDSVVETQTVTTGATRTTNSTPQERAEFTTFSEAYTNLPEGSQERRAFVISFFETKGYFPKEGEMEKYLKWIDGRKQYGIFPNSEYNKFIERIYLNMTKASIATGRQANGERVDLNDIILWRDNVGIMTVTINGKSYEVNLNYPGNSSLSRDLISQINEICDFNPERNIPEAYDSVLEICSDRCNGTITYGTKNGVIGVETRAPQREENNGRNGGWDR